MQGGQRLLRQDTRSRIIVELIALFPIASNVTLLATLFDINLKTAANLVASSAVALLLVLAAVGMFGSALGAS